MEKKLSDYQIETIIKTKRNFVNYFIFIPDIAYTTLAINIKKNEAIGELIFVNYDYRNQKIGEFLLTRVIEEMEKKKVERIITVIVPDIRSKSYKFGNHFNDEPIKLTTDEHNLYFDKMVKLLEKVGYKLASNSFIKGKKTGTMIRTFN